MSAVAELLRRRNTLKVLQFHKVPFLDRRLLAMIIRACPHVEMVGIYDCPLVHFGDVTCLLDLIHEVNRNRAQLDLPRIGAFDFCPSYHEGMPFQHPWADGYVLSWAPIELEITQRGSFAIVLKAFMKAKAMKLDLLFSKSASFVKFLLRIPNYSLAMAGFLDACHRLVDQNRRGRRAGPIERTRTIYDLLKPVRMGLDKEAANHYPDKVGSISHVCSSCGYEMLREFFTDDARRQRRHVRICAACILFIRLDSDVGQLRPEKREMLGKLFPNWEANAFNKDAPLAGAARGLVMLYTTDNVRPPTPNPVMQANGYVVDPPYEEPLLRDNKRTQDSLQGLPSLQELVESEEYRGPWSRLQREGRGLDMYTRVVWRLRDQGARVPTTGRLVSDARLDGGFPDHPLERQPPTEMLKCKPCTGVSKLTALETLVYNKGWI